jgi:hypothetical protein
MHCCNSSAASTRNADAFAIANSERITITDSGDAKHAGHANAIAFSDCFTIAKHARHADAIGESFSKPDV